jgi:tetratricopeptide (TPR) repeat protein
MNGKGKQIIVIVLLIIGLVAMSPLNQQITRDRMLLQYAEPTPIAQIVKFNPAGITTAVMGAILGGFRGVARNILWMKMDEAWDSGRWHDCLFIMRTVTLVDPHFIEGWKTTSWHLMYNMTVETDDEDLKQLYLREGADVLKEGISWNPDTYELYWELGWDYFDKVDDYDQAARWFKDAIQFDHPEYIERMMAHGYERKPDIQKALDWYDYCLKRYPFDGTAIGATITIRQRYLVAWRLMEQGKYDDAIREVSKQLAVEPKDTIGNKLLATIYERKGDLNRALEAWEFIRDNFALDSFAQRKVKELKAELGIVETAMERQQRLAKERAQGGMAEPGTERKYNVPK